MTPPVRPEKQQDPLDFLGTMGDDPLEFLSKPQGQAGDPLDFLSGAAPEPFKSPVDTMVSDAIRPANALAARDALRQQVPSALEELRTLMERPDISGEQRQRIQRIRSAMLQFQDGDDPPDPLWKQFFLTMTQGAIHVPTAIARTVGLDAAADVGEHIIENIEPTIDPQGGNLQAVVQAAGAAIGETGGSMYAFRPISAGVSALGGAAARGSPRVARVTTEAVEGLAARATTRTGSEALGNMIRSAPNEMIAGTILQGLMDPESLSTPEGVGMAILFGTLGAAGRGYQITKLAAREAQMSKAKQFVDNVATAPEAKKVAESQMSQADRQAGAQARLAARQAWDTAEPELRRQLMPGFDVDIYKEKWGKLTEQQRVALVDRVRGIARVSILKQLENPVPAGPQPATVQQLKVSQIGEELEAITRKGAVNNALAERGVQVTENADDLARLQKRRDQLTDELDRRRKAGDPEPDMSRAELAAREAARDAAPASGAPPSAVSPVEPSPTALQTTPPAEPAAGRPNSEMIAQMVAGEGTKKPLPKIGKMAADEARLEELARKGVKNLSEVDPAPGSPAFYHAKVFQALGRDNLSSTDMTRIMSRVTKLHDKHKGINLEERIKTLIKAEKKALAERPEPASTTAQKEMAKDIKFSGEMIESNLKIVKSQFPDMDPKQQMALADGMTSGQDWAVKKFTELMQAKRAQPAPPPTSGAGTAAVEAPAGIPASSVAPEAPSVAAQVDPVLASVAKVEQKIAKAAQLVEPAKPVEVPTVIPPSETVPTVKVGESPVKPKQPKKYRPLATVNRDIKILEKKLTKGDISQADYTEQLDLLVREKAALKTAKPAKPAAEAPAAPVVTRGDLDQAAVDKLTVDQLREQQTRLKMALAKPGALDPIRSQELKHDMHLVQRELRMKKPVNELLDDALDTHAKELEARWMATPEATRGPIVERLREVDAEFKKRSRPSIINVFKEERGSLYVHPDPLETNAGELPPHSRRLQDQIEIDLEGDKPFPSLQDAFEKLHTLYQHTIRMTHAADVATTRLGIDVEKAPAIRNPGKYAELILGANPLGRAQRMMQFGPFRWDDAGNVIESGVPGMTTILDPLKGKINDLRRFIRAQQIMDTGAKAQTNINTLDAVREVTNATPEIRKAAAELTRFRSAILDYFKDSGMLSPEGRADLEKLLHAGAPLYRYMQGRNIKVSTVGAKQGEFKGPVGARQVAARIAQAVEDRIIDPLRVTVDMTRRMIVAADRNRLGVMLVDSAEMNPDAAHGLIWRDTKIKSSIDPEIQKQARLLQEGARQNGFELPNSVAEEIALGFSDKRLKTKTDQLQVWRNGKREVWNISPELAAMYNGYAPHEMHLAIRMLGWIPQTAKTLITDNPAFGLVNMIRDTFEATLQTRHGFRFGLSSMEGFIHSLTNSKYRQEFLAGAGTAGGITGRSIESTRSSLEAVLPRVGAEHISSKLFHPLNALRQMTIPFEEAARLGEFIRARQSGAAIMDAALAAQRVTTNFQQRGLSMQGINHIVMFLNPAIQSLDTNMRSLARNPKRVAAAGFGLISMPSIYLWAANRGDKEIEELRKSKYGSGFWYFRTNEGTIGRMNKPFLFGAVFGTAMENALDSIFDQDPTAGDRFVTALAHQLPYNFLPNMLNLTLGLKYNKDFTTGTPIAPDRLESGDGQVEPRFQARPETGPTARALGDVINYSPAKIEFVVRNALGTMGQDVLRGIDMANDARDKYPAPVKADMPVIGRFFARYPSAGAHNIRRFYDNAKKHEVTVNTLRMLEKSQPERVGEYIEQNKHKIALSELYADVRKDLAELRAAGEAFAVMPPHMMSPKQKRDQISMIQDKMIEISRVVNGIVDKLDKEEAARVKAAAPSVSKSKPSFPADSNVAGRTPTY